MKNKKTALILSVIFLAGCTAVKPDSASKGPQIQTPLARIKKMMSGAVKYIPSGGTIMLSEDDDIYTYYSYDHDETGKTTQKKCYNVGPDKIEYTADDTLKYHLAYEYDNAGKLTGDVCYNKAGPDNLWFTSDDIETYHSAYEYDLSGSNVKIVRFTPDKNVFDYTAFETNSAGAIVKDAVYKTKGADGRWFTKDDEIEKYHRFDYDGSGNLLRAMEYHVKQNGKGADGVWFTQDDVISSTKVFVYGSKGMLVNIEKYIGSGQDKQWFTGDDVPQYYTVYTYTEDAYPGKEIDKIRSE
jgi:hypothetical protein